MKSVGEAMAIGRTFKESLQKCLRSLETWWPCACTRSGLGGDGKPLRIGSEVYGDRDTSRKTRFPSMNSRDFPHSLFNASFSAMPCVRLGFRF